MSFPSAKVTSMPYPHISVQVFGLPDRQQVMEETIRLVASFLGLAVGAGLIQFISVSNLCPLKLTV